MAKSDKSIDPIVAAINDLVKRVNVLIALSVLQSNQAQEKNIKLLAKMGMGYDEIEKILGVSSATIAKTLK